MIHSKFCFSLKLASLFGRRTFALVIYALLPTYITHITLPTFAKVCLSNKNVNFKLKQYTGHITMQRIRKKTLKLMLKIKENLKLKQS